MCIRDRYMGNRFGHSTMIAAFFGFLTSLNFASLLKLGALILLVLWLLRSVRRRSALSLEDRIASRVYYPFHDMFRTFTEDDRRLFYSTLRNTIHNAKAHKSDDGLARETSPLRRKSCEKKVSFSPENKVAIF
eukprot:TRINITY_DN1219_c0_g1_i2.p1 TRINITY_DN1219_c0_g1~~TRINITY_DN1219_c0_g1_i2.p1  ORF type:complete len:133 (+),score=24.33 TRINITY_DN1219_c0_g1_i2:63-461(+)